MSYFSGKRVLIAGGTGMIGMPLVELLLEQDARVRIASLDNASRAHPEAEFIHADLTNFANCMNVCEGMDYVFQLAGVKGSPAVTTTKPASFFVPTILFNTLMLEAARKMRVAGYLYTSTIGVYAPAEIMKEDDVWKTHPSENDRYAGWAKRMGELQVDAYRIEFGWKNISIVRPANVYGPYDNFDLINAMVIPSLIKRAVDGENPLRVWGDGSQVRDFIHARDVARGTLLVAEKGLQVPVNLGSGNGVTIKRVVEIILSNLKNKPDVIWDTSRPTGDKKRILDMSRAYSHGFKPSISLEDGIREVIEWYSNHREETVNHYNVFTDKEIFR